jgi:hypothetical protein
MDKSIFLAKFWGWYLLIFFVILSFNPKRIKQLFNNLKDEKFLIILSFVSIIVGLLNILFHNVWEASWKLIITGIGWISLSVGLLLFIFPKQTRNWLAFMNIKFVQVLYTLLFLIGLYLLNISYGIIRI